MHSKAFSRAAENAVTYFIVTFIVTAGGLLKSVDMNNHNAILTALSTAVIAALVGAAKEYTGFSTVASKR